MNRVDCADPEGFDPVIHARSDSPRGYDVKPRQCAVCRYLFTPEHVFETVCKECQEDKLKEQEKRKVGQVYSCRKCEKPYTMQHNRQTMCPECSPKMRAAAAKMAGVKVDPDKVAPWEDPAYAVQAPPTRLGVALDKVLAMCHDLSLRTARFELESYTIIIERRQS